MPIRKANGQREGQDVGKRILREITRIAGRRNSNLNEIGKATEMRTKMGASE